MNRSIIFSIVLLALLAFSLVSSCYAGYTGLDGDDDIPESSYPESAQWIFNIFEVLYDAVFKAPMWVLMNAWTAAYNQLIEWGIAAPAAWAVTTLLFMVAVAAGVGIFLKLLDVFS